MGLTSSSFQEDGISAAPCRDGAYNNPLAISGVLSQKTRNIDHFLLLGPMLKNPRRPVRMVLPFLLFLDKCFLKTLCMYLLEKQKEGNK